MTGREFLLAHIGTIDQVYLDHEAGVLHGVLRCRCNFRGTEAEWHQHLARQIADAIEGIDEVVMQLPLDLLTA